MAETYKDFLLYALIFIYVDGGVLLQAEEGAGSITKGIVQGLSLSTSFRPSIPRKENTRCVIRSSLLIRQIWRCS